MFENLLLFSSGIIGFLTIILILFRYKKNSIANSYLILIFSVITIRFLIIGLLNIYNEEFLKQLLERFNNLFIIMFPLNYLYFKYLIKNKKTTSKRDWIHFILPLLFITIDILEDNQIITVPNKSKYFVAFFICYLLYYNIKIYRFLNNNVWRRKFKIDFVKQSSLIKNWTLFLYAIIVCISLRLVYSYSIEIFFTNYDYGHTFIWISGALWTIIFLRILIFPEILYGHSYLLYHAEEEEKRAATLISSFWKNASKIKITNTQDLQLQQKINGLVTNYMKEIDQFTADTHFLKDPKFSINDLANKLNIPKSHLAYLFKYHSTISFSDFKKVVRIKYALKLIAEDYLKTNTYDSLAKEIGFASYNTFFTSFKEIVGVTPHDYQN